MSDEAHLPHNIPGTSPAYMHSNHKEQCTPILEMHFDFRASEVTITEKKQILWKREQKRRKVYNDKALSLMRETEM